MIRTERNTQDGVRQHSKLPTQKRLQAMRFVNLAQQMRDSGQIPELETYEDLGPFLGDFQELIAQFRLDGAACIDEMLLANPDKDVISVLSVPKHPSTAEQPQEEQDEPLAPYLKRNHKQKLIFIRQTEEDIENFPDLEWLVSGILPASSVSLVFGPSGTGKTFNGLHWAQCIARGMQWFGHPTKQGNVLYIYAEGKLGLKPRLQAWRKYHRADKTRNVTYITVPAQLKADRTTLIDTIQDAIDSGEKPQLMIIDTFSNCANGVDQSAQKEVHEVLAVCHEIKDMFGIHVMLIHHTNKAGDFNGTMAFRNHVDTMIELVPEPAQEGLMTMRCEKQRDGAQKFADIKLSLITVDLGLNPNTYESLSSCVLELSNAPTAAEAQNQSIEQERATMLDILALHGELTTNRWKSLCKEQGISARAFQTHNKKLQAEKAIKSRTKGKTGTAIYWSLASKQEG